jgi:gamma-glutamyl:cysteine ligase YbdK (ATP-grasp superfamily)
VELREMDSQSSIEHVAALAALVRALVVEAASGEAPSDVPSEALDWSSFRAARDGAEATVLDGTRPRRLADVARDAVERLRPLARDVGDEDALEGIGAMLDENGAVRQRASFARGGMPRLLRDLVEDTARTGVPAVPGG